MQFESFHWLSIISYPTRAHGIFVNDISQFQKQRALENDLKNNKHNIIASTWDEKILERYSCKILLLASQDR